MDRGPFNDGMFIGLFIYRGYFTINKTGKYSDGSPRHRPAARITGEKHVLPMFDYIVSWYGGTINDNKSGKPQLEFVDYEGIRMVCDLMCDSVVPLPAKIEKQMDIIMRFLSLEMPAGHGSNKYLTERRAEIRERREDLYVEMKNLWEMISINKW
jgi:hypothetical protein